MNSKYQKGETWIIVMVVFILGIFSFFLVMETNCYDDPVFLLNNADEGSICHGAIHKMISGEAEYPEGYDKNYEHTHKVPTTGDSVCYDLRIINGVHMLCDENNNCFEQPQF